MKKRGALFAISHTVAFYLYDMFRDKVGRSIILVCVLNNVMYTLVILYAPNCGQLPFLHALKKKVDRIKKGFLLYCRDLCI